MRNNHWSVNCAIIYLILIFIINIGFSTWSTIEHSRLTHDFNNSGQAATISQGFERLIESLQSIPESNNSNEIQIKAEQLASTARSALIHLLLSSFASIFTTIALMFPKIAMEIIEKFIEIPDIDYDSIGKFQLVMVLANISIFLWDIYGVFDTFKYI
ncbi:hypothetical protein NYE70_22070 [Paenibacillus sp. FSL R5-0407]|uniref:hypothetical protein n=1 Tax=unclassified Paenibacillus TaxID=185978 RepID=UPI0012FDDA48|nr:hypothetical protein [Paenibacillus sp. RUD330]QID16104.1 hypothetical protein CIC07_25615 [Paenibacillus sp. RUD330]